MQAITAIIVDDEPLAREGLALRLQCVADFSVLAQCATGEEALAAVVSQPPDVLFVDIEMPGLSGLDLANEIRKRDITAPKIVFVTAYKDFAVDAFACHAFDYLLKPYSEERLSNCIEKLRTAFAQDLVLTKQQKLDQLLSRRTGRTLDGFMHSLEHSPQASLEELQQTISLKSGTQWLRIQIDQILWIEAAGDYMCVHTYEGTHIIRKTLKQFEQELDHQRFVRISRSAIVNQAKVRKLTPNSNGEYIAQLCTGDEVKVSRLYKLKLGELNPAP
jgi:two-component system LytT family response regulator